MRSIDGYEEDVLGGIREDEGFGGNGWWFCFEIYELGALLKKTDGYGTSMGNAVSIRHNLQRFSGVLLG